MVFEQREHAKQLCRMGEENITVYLLNVSRFM